MTRRARFLLATAAIGCAGPRIGATSCGRGRFHAAVPQSGGHPQLRHGPRSSARIPARLDRPAVARQRAPLRARLRPAHRARLPHELTHDRSRPHAAAPSSASRRGSGRTSTGRTAISSGSATRMDGRRSTTTWPRAGRSSRSTRSVVAGQAIGQSGCSGLCTGPHLHFEVLVSSGGWHSVDPMAGRLWTTWPGRVRVPRRLSHRVERQHGGHQAPHHDHPLGPVPEHRWADVVA